MALYDRICADSTVVNIRTFKPGGPPTFTVSCIAPDDTSQLRTRYVSDAGVVNLVWDAPAWRLGDLDSTLIQGLPTPWQADSGFYSLPEDTVEARESQYFARLDSVREVEEKLWSSWPPERRLSMLIALEEKARARGRPWTCWKGP